MRSQRAVLGPCVSKIYQMITYKTNQERYISLVIHCFFYGITKTRCCTIKQVIVASRFVWEPHHLGNNHRPSVGSRFIVRVPEILYSRSIVVYTTICGVKMGSNTDICACERVFDPTMRFTLPSQAWNPDNIICTCVPDIINNGLDPVPESLKINISSTSPLTVSGGRFNLHRFVH